MAEKEVLKETDEWIKNLKNLLPSVSSENQEYVQSRIELLERLREMAGEKVVGQRTIERDRSKTLDIDRD